MTVTRKKLIEVALPLEAINAASVREKSIRHGHPSTLHLWWARRPLAAARAVIFAQMVDDPSSCPELFPTEKAQEKERQRLFKIIEELVLWENTTNETVLQKARDEIWQSWRRACADNADHPRAKELFNRNKLPAFHDPFAGGGSLPLEAQRLGLEAYASDLNPVAVLINKAMIEIPPRFAGQPPVNPATRQGSLFRQDSQDGQDQARNPGNPVNPVNSVQFPGATGLAEDVRYYGQWMRDEAEKRIGHLYPKVEITAEMARDRPDLKPLVGQRLTVIAWLWARTVKSPNPAFRDVDVPLVTTFMLSTKPGKEAYVQPVIDGHGYRFTVKVGKPKNLAKLGSGTSAGKRKAFVCLMSGVPIDYDYIREQSRTKHMQERLMAIVCEGPRGRVFLSPTDDAERASKRAQPQWMPDAELPNKHRNFQPPVYGIGNVSGLFSARQLVALSTFSELVADAYTAVLRDAQRAGLPSEGEISSMAIRADAYARAVATYLALAVGRSANYWSSFTPWGGDFIVQTFGRQAIPMVWDHAEANPFSTSTGHWAGAIEWIERVITTALSGLAEGHAEQADAQTQSFSSGKVVCTDPPYYDNICYADLSDFFYVWLRKSLMHHYPDLFATLVTPKADELVASPTRHGGVKEADAFFLSGMSRAMSRLLALTHASFPVTIFYAYRQSESQDELGTASTGWETFLEAAIGAGVSICGTWPLHTERDQGLKTGTNVLASSIVLVCGTRPADGATATRRQFVSSLQAELPPALAHLQRANIAPVDLAQAAIGPGMAVYTRYSKVLDASGQPVSVREALALINQVLDETLAAQEGDLDADSRWAVAWFEQWGFREGEYGVAETLSKAKDTSVEGMVQAGIVQSGRGKVRLLKPDEPDPDWDPGRDKRLTVWEMVHHLIRTLEAGGEKGAAKLAARLGNKAEDARALAYRLYTISERKKRPSDALRYNALVQSWPEIQKLAAGSEKQETQERLI